MTEPILGIDLGTTNSAVGIVDSGFPILLANSDNQRVISSTVCYDSKGTCTVGKPAHSHSNDSTLTCVTSAKRLIGQNQLPNFDFPLPLVVENNQLKIKLESQTISPIEVSSEILKTLKNQAESQLGYPVNKAVISVPAYFNDSQRNATILAAKSADLEVVRILSEPTAAALAYGLDKLEDSSKVIVYDLGGGTFDISLLELSKGVFKVIATSGDTQLGGDDIDSLLAEHLWKKYSNLDFHEQNLTTKNAFTNAAKTAKEALSTHKEFTIEVSLSKDIANLQLDITLEELQDLLFLFIQKTLNHCKKVLSDAEVKDAKEEIASVVMVGGSTRIPFIREKVGAFFEQEVDCSQHPDEAIALGAVIQAGILSGALKKMVLIDVTPLSLGIETYGGLMNVIIPRNSTIPCKAGEMFTNAINDQKSMSIRVLQGEREMAKDNWKIGKLNVPFQPMKKGNARVGVQFSIDENGILEILTRDTHTQQDIKLEIQSAAVDVSDESVEKMVSESVEHAFTDMSKRVFTEAKLKAEELLPAVEVAMQQVGNLLSDKDKDNIIDSKENVLASLQTQDAKALKQAVQSLDKQTEYLATLLIEKAMEDALLKKLND